MASAKYAGISPAIFNDLKSKLSAYGINMSGNSGRISEKGVSAEYQYDEASQTLAVNNVNVGFPASMMYSADKILGKISEEVNNAGGQLA